MKKCPRCKKQNEDEARYCYNCGELLVKDDGRPSLDDYLPHDLSGKAINKNGERIIENDDEGNEVEEDPTPISPSKEEFPSDKRQASFSNNGAPFFDNETGPSDEEMRNNASKEKEGETLGLISVCTFFTGTIGLAFGIIGLCISTSKKGKELSTIGIILGGLAMIGSFFLFALFSGSTPNMFLTSSAVRRVSLIYRI